MIDSASKAIAVTPSDSAVLPAGCAALYIGVQGDVNVLLVDDTVPRLFKDASGVLPICAKSVYSTSTTASSILALY